VTTPVPRGEKVYSFKLNTERRAVRYRESMWRTPILNVHTHRAHVTTHHHSSHHPKEREKMYSNAFPLLNNSVAFCVVHHPKAIIANIQGSPFHSADEAAAISSTFNLPGPFSSWSQVLFLSSLKHAC